MCGSFAPAGVCTVGVVEFTDFKALIINVVELFLITKPLAYHILLLRLPYNFIFYLVILLMAARYFNIPVTTQVTFYRLFFFCSSQYVHFWSSLSYCLCLLLKFIFVGNFLKLSLSFWILLVWIACQKWRNSTQAQFFPCSLYLYSL